MLLPPGAEGPAHTHHDVEEAFFVLEGRVRVGIHRGPDETEYRTLGYRDMIVVPAGVTRSLKNEGDTDALFCVIIGTQKPQVPTYPSTPRCTASPVTDPATGRRTVVVTGAGRGLGEAMARRAADDGYRVVVAELNEEWGSRTAEAIREAGGAAQFVPLDVADPHSVEALAARVAAAGPVYALVNSAALANGVGGGSSRTSTSRPGTG